MIMLHASISEFSMESASYSSAADDPTCTANLRLLSAWRADLSRMFSRSAIARNARLLASCICAYFQGDAHCCVGYNAHSSVPPWSKN